MSRRQVARAASPEAVFAQRRGETPYQIYFEISNIGRNVESSKKRARWKFCFGDEGREHEVTLVHSLMSGKKKTFFNGEMINEAQKVAKEWSFAWSFGAHLLRVGINFEEYGLVIDGIPFRSFNRRDPYMAAQLEATKRDSMKSLQSDEQRRFDRLGYSRSRTAERRRPSGGSGRSGGGSHDGSTPRSASAIRSRDRDGGHGRRRPSRATEGGTNALHRSGSIDDMSARGRKHASPTRASSSRRLQSPPSASGPGEQSRAGKSSKPKGSRSAPSANGSANKSKDPASAQAPSADILSADPSTLEVNIFDPNLPDASFDPLGNGNAPAATGAGHANGSAAHAGGGGGGGGGGGRGGGWTGAGGGFGDAFGGGGQNDAAAVLQLGMQFEAMGMSSQPQQQQQHFMQPQQGVNQQPAFDEGAYQHYDHSGFPVPAQQQAYIPPQQAAPLGRFGDPVQAFGAPGGDPETNFFGGYPANGQLQQQEQQQGQGPPVGTSTELVEHKPSIDPWDAARSGMVNIDDITDTKHKPAVEVKPFTNSHRPLADLVREAPAKTNNAVMIERPEPPPTHMAVAIVPVQQSRQREVDYGYPQPPAVGYPQQQNGNPFAQLQLTQLGQQAQPILYTKPDDPFYDL